MCRPAILAVLISMSLNGLAFADERSMAIASLSSLAFANGERLASSRYATIVSPGAEQVQLTFNGVNEIYIDAELSIDTVKFKDNDALAAFLKDSGVKPANISKIVEKNRAEGFVHSSDCKGRRSECVIESQYVDFAIDYYDKIVRVFFAPDILLQDTGEDSYLKMNGGVGLVNNIAAYYDDGINGNNPTYFLRDQGRSGFNSGYITYNVYKSDNQSQVDDLYVTHALLQNSKFAAGRISSASDFNASSSQSLFSGAVLTGLRIGTASEYVDRSYGNRTFRYYSPENGRVEVRRNGSMIYTSSTGAGYNDLNLDGLPSGNYTAELIVRSASGNIISRQSIIVNNVNGSVNEFAWHLFGGRSSDSYGYVPTADKKVIEGGFQVPFLTNTALFFGGGAVGSLGVASSGINYAGEVLSLTAKLGGGSDSLRYYESSIFLGGLSLSYNKTTSGERWTEGQQGKRSDTSFTANYNTTLTDALSVNGGYLYTANQSPLILTGIDRDNNLFNERDSRASRYNTRSVYANIFYTAGNGISIYAGMNKELSGSPYNVSLGFSIPLFNNKVNLSNSTYYTEGGKATSSATADYTNNISDSWSQKISASTYLADQKYNSLGYTLSHNSQYLYGAGYYYQTDNGQRRYTLSGNSTQVISGNGLDFVSSGQLQNAFITIDKDVTYDIAVKDMTTNTTTYIDGKKRIIPVSPYHKLRVTASTESGGYILEGGKSRETRTVVMVPGSTTNVSTKAIKVNSLIVTARNDAGGYLPGATCAADNCVSTGRLSSGVYRVKFTGESTQIRAGNYSCKVEAVPGKRFYDVTCR
ncbi:TcfC E-set like domain-containing protein [Yersinia ruckeri]|uniref:TcfC E-set like domain-containing protein n=3 Tax=Yersinia ruckeri TaxID=29486 RepID=UPI0022371B47|nr:TcfC E-set like domain-containing protein [Yersinia ruckeri]EKN4699394.1 TcfC E-set like domain-containing protein [Yersinia ruckeri]MCW6586059.1 TcfC E-set like domain-containing protein [Yersinia ruckeri]